MGFSVCYAVGSNLWLELLTSAYVFNTTPQVEYVADIALSFY